MPPQDAQGGEGLDMTGPSLHRQRGADELGRGDRPRRGGGPPTTTATARHSRRRATLRSLRALGPDLGPRAPGYAAEARGRRLWRRAQLAASFEAEGPSAWAYAHATLEGRGAAMTTMHERGRRLRAVGAASLRAVASRRAAPRLRTSLRWGYGVLNAHDGARLLRVPGRLRRREKAACGGLLRTSRESKAEAGVRGRQDARLCSRRRRARARIQQVPDRSVARPAQP